MGSRGRRGVPARDGEQRRDEPRREDQGEQQAPAPQGPVLPPPPPVDYGVFMQGLVQAMQMQAHTQAALQAQLEAQERADVWWSSLLRTRFKDGAMEVGWDEFALSAACRQEGEMEQYLEEKKVLRRGQQLLSRDRRGRRRLSSHRSVLWHQAVVRNPSSPAPLQLDLLPCLAQQASLQGFPLIPLSFLLKGWLVASGDGDRSGKPPLAAKRLLLEVVDLPFWNLGLVSTCFELVSTCCPSLATGSSGIWD
ncbi:hypothetical protein Taro_014155 [Colocasia esculenta]|uniref:Uncharacterized protein n=1 Tax=Colocasia esculenta TaxID=4460 RepID=A0A843UDX3_COLES|nr:hypothetical protein [Colocasia esculenta]